jgi:hypothetical protein
MYYRNQILYNPADFDNAILFQLTVSVWQNGELLDNGGVIELNKEGSVKINGSYYLKINCEFRIS